MKESRAPVRLTAGMLMASLLIAPGSSASGSEPGRPGGAPAAEVGFTLASKDAPLILVPVRVNGKGPYRFILDTGASGTILAAELAKRVRVEGQGPAKGIGAGGAIELSLGKVRSLAVGEAEVKNVEVAIGDAEAVNSGIGSKVDGILGYDFLRRFRVTIDYPNGKLRLEQGGQNERR